MAPRAPINRLAAEECGIPEEHLSQERIEWMIREAYVPMFNQHLRDGHGAVAFLNAHREPIQQAFIRKVDELPESVKQHIPYQMELVLYMYERLKYIRWYDPCWLNIMPEIPVTLRPFISPTSI